MYLYIYKLIYVQGRDTGDVSVLCAALRAPDRYCFTCFTSVLSKASKAASYRGGVPSKAPAQRAPTPR